MSAPAKRKWTLADFRSKMLDEDHREGRSARAAVFDDFLAWAKRWGGECGFSGEATATGPLYGQVPDRAGELVNALSLNLGGDVGLRYIELRDHPPFREDDDVELRDLTDRLSDVLGTPVPLTEKAFNVRLEFLLKPEVREAFFGVLDEMARRLSQHRR